MNLLQPLHSIMDLSKAAQLDTSAISQLWTTYHQAKGFLSAAIPTATYEKMVQSGKKYPIFVLPLARDVVGELPDGSETASAIEMYLLVSLMTFRRTLQAAVQTADIPPIAFNRNGPSSLLPRPSPSPSLSPPPSSSPPSPNTRSAKPTPNPT